MWHVCLVDAIGLGAAAITMLHISGIDLNNDKTPEMVKAVSDEQYQLDYISGATITSDGLNQFIGSHILGRYKSILSEVNE